MLDSRLKPSQEIAQMSWCAAVKTDPITLYRLARAIMPILSSHTSLPKKGKLNGTVKTCTSAMSSHVSSAPTLLALQACRQSKACGKMLGTRVLPKYSSVLGKEWNGRGSSPPVLSAGCCMSWNLSAGCH